MAHPLPGPCSCGGELRQVPNRWPYRCVRCGELWEWQHDRYVKSSEPIESLCGGS